VAEGDGVVVEPRVAVPVATGGGDPLLSLQPAQQSAENSKQAPIPTRIKEARISLP
jgi:hypothetical protein